MLELYSGCSSWSWSQRHLQHSVAGPFMHYPSENKLTYLPYKLFPRRQTLGICAYVRSRPVNKHQSDCRQGTEARQVLCSEITVLWCGTALPSFASWQPCVGSCAREMGLDMVTVLNPRHDVLCGGMSRHVQCCKSLNIVSHRRLKWLRPLG